MRRQVDHDGLVGPSSCWAGHRADQVKMAFSPPIWPLTGWLVGDRCPRRQRHEEFLAPCVKHPAVYCKF